MNEEENEKMIKLSVYLQLQELIDAIPVDWYVHIDITPDYDHEDNSELRYTSLRKGSLLTYHINEAQKISSRICETDIDEFKIFPE